MWLMNVDDVMLNRIVYVMFAPQGDRIFDEYLPGPKDYPVAQLLNHVFVCGESDVSI